MFVKSLQPLITPIACLTFSLSLLGNIFAGVVSLLHDVFTYGLLVKDAQ